MPGGMEIHDDAISGVKPNTDDTQDNGIVVPALDCLVLTEMPLFSYPNQHLLGLLFVALLHAQPTVRCGTGNHLLLLLP